MEQIYLMVILQGKYLKQVFNDNSIYILKEICDMTLSYDIKDFQYSKI